MNEDRQQFLKYSRLVTPAFAFAVTLMRRLPQDYESKVMALVNAYPRIAEDQIVETNTASLGILWRCQAGKVPHVLQDMMAESQGDITYTLSEPKQGVGLDVRIAFSIPEAREEEA